MFRVPQKLKNSDFRSTGSMAETLNPPMSFMFPGNLPEQKFKDKKVDDGRLPFSQKVHTNNVLQNLLRPDLTFRIHKHILESDDHAFNSDECKTDCCKQSDHFQRFTVDDNCNNVPLDFSIENPPKLSPEKRRDHLHLLKRRKSRAR